MTAALADRAPNKATSTPGERAFEVIDQHRHAAGDRMKIEPLDVEFPTYATRTSRIGESSLWLARFGDNLARAYKWRGALNAMVDDRENGADANVVYSAGNALYGALVAADITGQRLTGFVPSTAPERKTKGAIEFAAARGIDFQLKIAGNNLHHAQQAALEYATKHGVPVISPFDDPRVIAGQGTMLDDILLNLPPEAEGQQVNVLVPVGGGGAFAGLEQRNNELEAGVAMYGIEAEGSDSMSRSLRKPVPQEASHPNPRFKGLEVARVGEHVLAVCNRLVTPQQLVRASDRQVNYVQTSYLDDYETRRLDPADPETLAYEPSSLVAIAGLAELAPRLTGVTIVIGTGHNAPLEDFTAKSPFKTPRSRIGHSYKYA